MENQQDLIVQHADRIKNEAAIGETDRVIYIEPRERWSIRKPTRTPRKKPGIYVKAGNPEEEHRV